MPFNDKSVLDPSQVQDRRGRNVGKTVAFGGGGIGLVILVVSLLFGVNPADLVGIVEQVPAASVQDTGSVDTLAQDCQTGADANAREDCRIVGFVNSIQAYWTDEFENQGGEYIQAKTIIFSGATEGACGYATSAVGPFYCSRDQAVYLDLDFFNEMQTNYGAKGGPFAEAYVLAHEYGHHVQNLLGLLDESSSSGDTGPQSMSVLTELQADCLAGVWVYHATETGYLTQVTEEEIIQSLDVAASLGDDRIQTQTQGYVSPEAWTHGSSDQRLSALKDGIQTGDFKTCETPGWTP